MMAFHGPPIGNTCIPLIAGPTYGGALAVMLFHNWRPNSTILRCQGNFPSTGLFSSSIEPFCNFRPQNYRRVSSLGTQAKEPTFL